MQRETDIIYEVDADYPLVPGDWDIHYKNIKTKESTFYRYKLSMQILIKDLPTKTDCKIIAAKRIR